ncbi:MAG: rod shape-determining protein MreD [Bacteroidia bacterium]|jgi:hypothetical protein
MNPTVLINILRFIALLAVQVVVFNGIDLFGFINAYPYILFIILYPANGNKAILLISAFAMGLLQDQFNDTGGPHALASVVLAFIRPTFFRFAFGISYEYQTIKINDRMSPERLIFIFLCIVTHHFILFMMELFRFNLILDVLLRTIVTTIFTLLVSVITIYLIKPGKQQ